MPYEIPIYNPWDINLHLNAGLAENYNPMGFMQDWSPNSSGTYSVGWENQMFGGTFKVFIPPGTIYLTAHYGCPSYQVCGHDLCMTVCWGEKPEMVIWVPETYYDGILTPYWPVSIGVIQATISLRLRAEEGIISDIKPIKTGDWLYIAVHSNGDTNTTHHETVGVSVYVDKEVYSNWYYKAQFDAGTGDPLTFSSEPTKPIVTYIDPYIEALKTNPNAEYPQPWDIKEQYPWTKPFPWPFSGE